MSEYQYYEFRAVDRPLTRDEMGELRALSSRAVITPTSFQNTYNYGDFRGDPQDLMKEHFDAHVYVSNFGLCVFMLRLPSTALPGDEVAPYAADDALDRWESGPHTVVEWRFEEDSSGEWVEGEAWMASLLPIREELLSGDYRSLYIGWLRSVQAGVREDEEADQEGEEDENLDGGGGKDGGIVGALEPPVPPGLRCLTAAQAALAEFLQIDADLIEAAAATSADPSSGAASLESIDRWAAQLPDEEVRKAIARILRGEGLAIQTELRNRYHRSVGASVTGNPADGRRRTAGELLALAGRTARERERREKEEKARRRREHLASLVPRFPSLWTDVDSAARRQTASAYDEACALLADLRDAYVQVGRLREFEEAFAGFCAEHGGRPALRRRLAQAGLVNG